MNDKQILKFKDYIIVFNIFIKLIKNYKDGINKISVSKL